MPHLLRMPNLKIRLMVVKTLATVRCDSPRPSLLLRQAPTAIARSIACASIAFTFTFSKHTFMWATWLCHCARLDGR